MRWSGVAVITVSLIACGRLSEPATEDAGAAFAGVPAADAGTTACKVCQNTACASNRQACAADLDCAPFLSCMDACPPDDSGAPAAACSAACARQDASDNANVGALQNCTASARCDDCIAPFDAGFGDPNNCARGFEALDGSPTPTGTCNTCVGSRCCAELERCADAPCQDALACIASCVADGGGGACYEICSAQQPDQMRNLAPAYACQLTFCENACSKGAPSTCSDCATTKCASETAQVLASPEASLYILCSQACSDRACLQACATAHATGGLSEITSYTTCETIRCTTECPH